MEKELLLPKTAFEMRGNLPKKEPALLEKWDKLDLYESMNEGRGPERYTLHDGPPYANGDIHCGHMLNRLLKDFVVRYNNMMGYETPFVFGFDTHGLPIEVQLSKSGIDRKKMGIVEFRKKCREYALTQVQRQLNQIHRLGVLGDYEHPYLTLDKEFEAAEIEVFGEMALKGLIYKGVKPVYWSPVSESALAEAEIDYKDVPVKTLYVAFPIKDGKGLLPEGSKALIWTTTPWTIPSNLAITLNPRFEYGVYETDKGTLVFLKNLEEKLKETLGLTDCRLIATYNGAELEGVKAHHPLYERESPFLLADFVTDDSGTGLVHTAPDHGVDDFNVCFRYGIKPFCPVDSRGIVHMPEDKRIDGLFYEKANDQVIEELREAGALLKEEDLVHSYPHDWRTGCPLIFRATPQWFCSIAPIKDEILGEIKKVKWDPSWGEMKMANMVKDRTDWCISRQRAWGVPIPIIYNEDGSPILEKEVFAHIAELIKEKGSDAWYELPAAELLPPGYKNALSPNGNFRKETDIMDVWFDSGSSWNAVLRKRGLPFPSDLYLEGNDQYRGWFNASLTLSVALTGKAPFKVCLTHGWVMDENWQKMSKSKGNGVDPSKVANEMGADLLRLYSSSVDFRSDVKMGETAMKAVSETYRKLRNTFRFLLGNLQDGGQAYVHEDGKYEYSLADSFIYEKLKECESEILERYERFDFSGVLSKAMSFLVSDLSGFYLDISKDILYCDAPSSPRRKAIQDVLFQAAYDLARLLNPILPFTMEEVYANLPLKEHKASLQLERMPKPEKPSEEILSLYEAFKKSREEANRLLEEGRAKGLYGSFADVDLYLKVADEKLKAALQAAGSEEGARLYGVAKLELVEDEAKVMPSQGTVCPRCRRHYEGLKEGELCKRCQG